MQILILLGTMYFDAVVVFVTSQTLLFRLALAILCSSKLIFETMLIFELSIFRTWNITINI